MTFCSIAAFVCRLPGGAWLLRLAVGRCRRDTGARLTAQIKREIEHRQRRLGLSRAASKKAAAEMAARLTN